MPSNIVTSYGNSSGATIPLVIATNYAQHFLTNSYRICMSGFSAGLTCASAIMNIGNLHLCEIIEF